jgi:hypothetical protein
MKASSKHQSRRRRPSREGERNVRLPWRRSGDGEPRAAAEQIRKNRAAMKLLMSWRAEDSGYDEEAWPKLGRAIEVNRLSARRRLDA